MSTDGSVGVLLFMSHVNVRHDAARELVRGRLPSEELSIWRWRLTGQARTGQLPRLRVPAVLCLCLCLCPSPAAPACRQHFLERDGNSITSTPSPRPAPQAECVACKFPCPAPVLAYASLRAGMASWIAVTRSGPCPVPREAPRITACVGCGANSWPLLPRPSSMGLASGPPLRLVYPMSMYGCRTADGARRWGQS